MWDIFLFYFSVLCDSSLEVNYLLHNKTQLLLGFNLLGISQELMFLLLLGNELTPKLRRTLPKLRRSLNLMLRRSLNSKLRCSLNPKIHRSLNPKIRRSLNPKLRCSLNPILYFCGGLECVGHSYTYVAYFVFCILYF
jgi:hypothetical protein